MKWNFYSDCIVDGVRLIASYAALPNGDHMVKVEGPSFAPLYWLASEFPEQ